MRTWLLGYCLLMLSLGPVQAQTVNRHSPLTHGLVAWWLAWPGKTGGTRWVDLVNGHVGTLTNMAVPPTTTSGWGKSTSRRGGFGEIRVDGSNDWVSVPDHPQLDLPTGLTLLMWVRNGSNQHYLMSKGEDAWFWAIGPSGQTANRLAFFLNGVGGSWLIGTSSLIDNVWHCVAATWNGATKAILVDGLVENSVAQAGTASTGASAVELFRRGATDTPISGAADGIMIYKRGLPPREVRAVCDEGKRGYPQMLLHPPLAFETLVKGVLVPGRRRSIIVY